MPILRWRANSKVYDRKVSYVIFEEEIPPYYSIQHIIQRINQEKSRSGYGFQIISDEVNKITALTLIPQKKQDDD